MSTVVYGTAKVNVSTDSALGSVRGLSTSDTTRLQEAYPKIGDGQGGAYNARATFYALMAQAHPRFISPEFGEAVSISFNGTHESYPPNMETVPVGSAGLPWTPYIPNLAAAPGGNPLLLPAPPFKWDKSEVIGWYKKNIGSGVGGIPENLNLQNSSERQSIITKGGYPVFIKGQSPYDGIGALGRIPSLPPEVDRQNPPPGMSAEDVANPPDEAAAEAVANAENGVPAGHVRVA